MEIKDFLIDENATMIDAMKQLDEVARKVLFVTSNNKFAAALTDGDIRRWILKNGDLKSPICNIANYKPKFIYDNDKTDAQAFLKKHSIEALPVLNEDGDIISIRFWDYDKVNNKDTLDLPVVIMAGGLGTRLYPYTKILPKPLIPIGEIPITERIIHRFMDYGIDTFHMIINHKKNMIKAYFNELDKAYSINYAEEEQPLGTGGGLSLLKGKINSPFILTNCDIIIDEDYSKMVAHHQNNNNLITMIVSLKNTKIPYGVIDISDNGEIKDMREKPEMSYFTNTGMYIVDSKVINELPDNTSIGFPDIITKYKNEGYRIGVFPISDKSWMDMGQIEELEAMRQRLEKNAK